MRRSFNKLGEYFEIGKIPFSELSSLNLNTALFGIRFISKIILILQKYLFRDG